MQKIAVKQKEKKIVHIFHNFVNGKTGSCFLYLMYQLERKITKREEVDDMESSKQVFGGQTGAHCRATYKGAGFDPKDLNRPHIGIANTFSEFSPGHSTT